MCKYYSFVTNDFNINDTKLYEYLVNISDSFKLFSYDDLINDTVFKSDKQLFKCETIYVYHNTYKNDIYKFFSLFYEMIAKTNILRFYSDNNSVEILSKFINLSSCDYNTDFKKCVINVNKDTIEQIIKKLQYINSLSFFKDNELIAQLCKMPDHIDCHVFDSKSISFCNVKNLWEYAIYSIVSNTHSLNKVCSINNLVPFKLDNEKQIKYCYLSFYTGDEREVLYFNSMSSYAILTINENELNYLKQNDFDLSKFKLVKEEDVSTFDKFLSSPSIIENFDIGFIDESLSKILIEMLDEIFGTENNNKYC